MPVLYNNTTSCTFNIASQDGKVNVSKQEDIVEEVNLIGTNRTLVPRFGFSSSALEFEIWLFESEYNKLILMRNAQSLNNKITYLGQTYSLTITSDIKKMLAQNIYFLTIRLKKI
jgi:hypothetical protein